MPRGHGPAALTVSCDSTAPDVSAMEVPYRRRRISQPAEFALSAGSRQGAPIPPCHGPPSTGHVPRTGPGLGTMHLCPRARSKNGHVPRERASKMSMSGGEGSRGACPAPGHGAGLPALDMSRARGQDWAQSTYAHGRDSKNGHVPRERAPKMSMSPGAQRKVAAPEGTATFKLQTAWPQGADSVRNTGN